jgi:hypothetical protein
MSKEQLVKIDPNNLKFCSIELKALLNEKLNDKELKLEVFIYSNSNSPLNVEIEENSCGGATVCEGYVWPDMSFTWERKSLLAPLCEISLLSVGQLAKIKRWTRRYMEELATHYEEELKGK